MMDATSVVSQLTNGTLVVTGTAFADTIDIRLVGDNILVAHATRNGNRVVDMGREALAASEIKSIQVRAGNGDDVVRFVDPTKLALFKILIDGEGGNDVIETTGSTATLVPGPGNNTLSSRDASIAIDYSHSSSGINADLLRNQVTRIGSAESDRLRNVVTLAGSSFDDEVLGSRLANTILGMGGNDHLMGFAGSNLLKGGEGDDILEAGRDGSELVGDAGADRLVGGPGDDHLEGGLGDDNATGGDGADFISGGPSGNDILDGGNGDDRLFGGPGQDIMSGGLGDDYLDGEDGDDKLSVSAGSNILIGGKGDDAINGGVNDDIIEGNEGDDTLLGMDGRDVILGGAGNDVIDNGAGDGTVSRLTEGDVVTAGPGVVQFLDDSAAPALTPFVDDAVAFKTWLDTSLNTNKSAVAAQLQQLNAQNRDIEKSKVLAIAAANQRDSRTHDAESRATAGTEELHNSQARLEELVDDARSATGAEADRIAKELVDLKKRIDELSDNADDGLSLGGTLGKIAGAVKQGFHDAGQGISNAASSFIEAGKTFAEDAAQSLVNAIRGAVEVGEKFIKDVAKVTDKALGDIADALADAAGDIADTFEKAIKDIDAFGVDLNQSAIKIEKGFEKAWQEKVVTAIASAKFPMSIPSAQDIIKGLAESPDRLSDWWEEKVGQPFNKAWKENAEPAWKRLDKWWKDLIHRNFDNQATVVEEVRIKPVSSSEYEIAITVSNTGETDFVNILLNDTQVAHFDKSNLHDGDLVLTFPVRPGSSGDVLSVEGHVSGQATETILNHLTIDYPVTARRVYPVPYKSPSFPQDVSDPGGLSPYVISSVIAEDDASNWDTYKLSITLSSASVGGQVDVFVSNDTDAYDREYDALVGADGKVTLFIDKPPHANTTDFVEVSLNVASTELALDSSKVSSALKVDIKSDKTLGGAQVGPLQPDIEGAGYVVTWKDFQGPVPANPDEDAHIEPRFDITFLPQTIGGKFVVTKLTMSVYVAKNLSWTRFKSNSLLAHEQGHYDLTVLMARDFLRETQQLALRSTNEVNFRAAYEALVTRYTPYLQKVQDLYDAESKHSLDPSGQFKWTGKGGIIQRGKSGSSLSSLTGLKP